MIVQKIKAVFDIAKANGMDLNVGLFMYHQNEALGCDKYKGAEGFDWNGDTDIDDDKWNALMRNGYDELTAARRANDIEAFNAVVQKYYI